MFITDRFAIDEGRTARKANKSWQSYTYIEAVSPN